MSARISASHVSVDFPIYGADARSLRKSLFSAMQMGRIAQDSRGRTIVKALRDVTVELNHGDRVGVVGSNGAGKSTLLRVFAGVYEPTNGTCKVQGRVASLLTLGLGMSMDMTGYENIKYCGMFLGMSPEEIGSKTGEIADFTELGEYLALRAHTYSTGMWSLLAFGIATALEPEILLVDESVGAGDASFIKKAENRMIELIEKSAIVVLATHASPLMRKWCNKALLLDKGEAVAFSDVDTVLALYEARTT
jgi:ABC-type polysaccharide/polyol phosphate transport system ATPase subunit